MDGLGKTDESAANEIVLNEKLAEIVHHAEMMTGSSGAAIALREGDSLVTHASTGTTAPDIGSRSRIRGSFTGLVIETGEPVRCDDSDNDHRVDPAVCRALQTRSIVVVPVRVADAVTGVLAVFASSPHSFSNVHVSAIKTLAEITGDIIAKYRPTIEQKQADATHATPHPDINRVSLQEAPGNAPIEEFEIEFVEEEVMQALSTLDATPVQANEPVFKIEPVVAQASEPAPPGELGLKFEPPLEAEPFAPVEVAKKSELVIGPGSWSQSPFISVVESATKLAEVIELAPPKREPEPVVAKPSELPKPETSMVFAMATAPPPAVKPPKVADAPQAKSSPAKREVELAPMKPEPVLSLADEPLRESKPKGKPEPVPDLGSWDAKPKREFNVFKYAVPVGLAAALLLAGWFYFTKWRNRAQATAITAVQEAPQTTVMDPITAAAKAQEAAQTANPQPGGLQPASLSTPTTTSAAPPPKAAGVEMESEDLEPEVVTTGPKPLVVQNAGAGRSTRTTQVARVEAPQVIASAGALPAPMLNVDSKIPKLQAKQSSLVPNQLMKSVPPIYPETARRLNLTGSVTVEAQIGADGKVREVKVVEGEPMLARAAIIAVKQWKYRPSYLNGEPVESSARIMLNFKPQTGQ
jgi:TonB family protein